VSVSGPARPRRDASEHRATVQALISLAVAAYVGTLIAGDRADPGVAALLYVALLAGSVVLHEAGHAVAARAVGGTIGEIRLGFGPALLARRVRNISVDLRLLLIAGHVSWGPRPGTRRGQFLLVSAAGPAMHLVLIAVACAGGGGPWSVWRIDLLIANVGALLSNLIPFRGGFGVTTTSPGHNDGASIAALLRGSRPGARAKAPALPLAASSAQRAAVTAAAGIAAFRDGDREAAESLLRQAMSYDPDEPTTRAFAQLLATTPRR